MRSPIGRLSARGIRTDTGSVTETGLAGFFTGLEQARRRPSSGNLAILRINYNRTGHVIRIRQQFSTGGIFAAGMPHGEVSALAMAERRDNVYNVCHVFLAYTRTWNTAAFFGPSRVLFALVFCPRMSSPPRMF
jgi:hypothetical protein